MGYLEPVARQYLELTRRSRRAARKSAERAARFAAEHPGKAASAAVLVGALAARAVSRHAAERALSKRLAESERGGDREGSKSTTRVFVILSGSSRAERDGMRNALVVGPKETDARTFDALSFETTSLLQVKFGTAIVLTRECAELSKLVSRAEKTASRIVAMCLERGHAPLGAWPGWRSYSGELVVGGVKRVIAAHVYAPGATVLIDADATFFSCTLVGDETHIVGRGRITGRNYFAGVGGSRLRADSMHACHHKVRALRRGQGDAGGFDRVFVVCPTGGWVDLARLLESHELATMDDKADVWSVRWNWGVKRAMLVVVSPAHGKSGHEDLFLMHCMLHNLRADAIKSGSDVRFTIGKEDARVLADRSVSPKGPRWTETRSVFAPFYASSPYIVLKAGPVAIGRTWACGARAQTRLDGTADSDLEAVLLSISASDLAGECKEEGEHVVSLAARALRFESGGSSTDVVALIAKRAYVDRVYSGALAMSARGGRDIPNLETWRLARSSGDYYVYAPKGAAGFGAGRSRDAPVARGAARRAWV